CTRDDEAASVPSTARKAFVIATEILASSNVDVDPSRRITVTAEGAVGVSGSVRAGVGAATVTALSSPARQLEARDRKRAHKPTSEPARPPSRSADSAHRRCARRRQVFGLAGRPGRRPGFLLAVASQALVPSAWLTAVVPAHRCGAVPDSHRIP